MGKDNLFSKEDIMGTPDDVFEKDKSYRKKVNGNRKGKNFERDTCKDLESRFGGQFRRVPQSGAFFGGMNSIKNKDVREDAKDILCGDIITPPGFPVIECKNYYDTPKLHNIVTNHGDATLDKWVDQARLESETSKREWVIIFKVTVYRGNSYIVVDRDKFLSLYTKHPECNFIRYKKTFIFDYDVFWRDFSSIYVKKI